VSAEDAVMTRRLVTRIAGKVFERLIRPYGERLASQSLEIAELKDRVARLEAEDEPALDAPGPAEKPYDDPLRFAAWLKSSFEGVPQTPRVRKFCDEAKQGKRGKLSRRTAENYVADLEGDATDLPDPDDLPVVEVPRRAA
jgi:hypothetical protein